MDNQAQGLTRETSRLSSIPPEALIDLLDELRYDARFRIGAEQYIAAQDLVLALVARGDNLEPRQLGPLLAPILCSSPREQEGFKDHFEGWMTRHQNFEVEVAQAVMSEEQRGAESFDQELTEVGRKSGLWLWAVGAMLVAVIALAGGGAFYFYNYPVSRVKIVKPSRPNIKPKKTVAPQAQPTTVATPIVHKPKPQPAKSKVIWINLWAIWLKLLFSTILVLLALVFAWKLWWLYRAHRFLVRRATTQEPLIQQVSIEELDLEGQLFPRLQLLHIAQELRRRVEIPSAELNVNRTIENTIRSGGILSPVYGTLQIRPEYLVLIDRTTHNDQQARFIDEMIDRLAKSDVFVTRYYFDVDPRNCFPYAEKGNPLALHELAQEYPNHRLLVFSDATGLFHAQTGEIGPWVEQLLGWSDRAILTPKAFGHWGYREAELGQQFIVLPTTVEGLAALTRSMSLGRAIFNATGTEQGRLPDELRLRPHRWIERDAPGEAQIERMLLQLRRFLGRRVTSG